MAGVIQHGVGGEVRRRYLSLDALRGFDMFWIVGGDFLVKSLVRVHDGPVTRWMAGQMEHCEWAGLHFYDVIFPVFVWMAGVAIPLSLPRVIEREGRGAAVRRVVVRGVVLFFLGVFYMGGVANGFGNIYLAGVLQRIGVAYLFAGVLFCFFKWRGLVAWVVMLLVGYWALLTFVAVPGVGGASYEEGRNLAHWVDQRWLPGQKFEGTLLSTLSAVATCVIGIFGGMILKDGRRGEGEKAVRLVAGGALLVGVGLVWSVQFPLIKLLWTSSYALVGGGIGAIALGVFHGVIEVWGWRGWCRQFVWIGANAITIYLVSGVVNFRKVADRLVGGEVAGWLGRWSDLVKAVVVLGMVLGLARFLYRRGIFLRV